MRWLGLFTNKTFRKHCKLIFPHRDFIICIVSLAIFHPHFFIRTFPSQFYHPHPPSAIRRRLRPPVDFVQGAFLELLIDSDLRFGLKLEQIIPVNCLLEGRDVFAVMPTGFGMSFFQPCSPSHSDRTEEHLRRRLSIRTEWF